MRKKTTEMKKVMKLLLGLLFLGICYLYVEYNLTTNSVYYAKNVKYGESRHPQLEMLVENLSWLDLPEIDDLRYDFDGHPLIIKNNKESDTFGLLADNRYIYIYKDTFFKFNNNMKLIRVSEDYEELPLENYNEQEVIQNIYNLVQPILDYQTKPTVNLQWLFNLKYGERFK